MSKPSAIDTLGVRASPRPSGQPSESQSQGMNLASKQRQHEPLYEDDEDDEEEDEEEEDEEDDLDEDDDSTYTSSPSIPDENINFDLVYALHTFVATVEGQASVTKGDALTLLDDSNSYWWLVSVLKTSEVGYIPAENIETPFERLARLNKHRNAEITLVAHVPFLQEKPKPVNRKPKKVVLSKDLSVQAQIILTGDDDDHEIGEAYEEWQEDMVDQEEEENDEDDDVSDMEQVTVPIVLPEKTPVAVTNHNQTQPVQQAYPPVQDHGLPPAQPQKSEPISPSTEEKRPAGANNTFWKLFSRTKKDIKAPGRSSEEDANSVASLTLSTVSEDNRQTHQPQDQSDLTVLRVFAGNINVNATYHSLLASKDTSAEQLLVQAMERFHISQIENKTSGQPLRTTSTGGVGGVEYYLTVKAMNGEEMTLTPEDKPLAIFQSLTDHLTTPMPSLTHVRQFSQQMTHSDGTGPAGSDKARQRANKTRFGQDSAIRFYLHKRIRRVSDGQMFIKVFLYTGNNVNDKEEQATRSTFSTRNLRRKKEQNGARQEHIEKLIAVSAGITIAELTVVALEKFHIVPQDENAHYRMALATSQKAEKLLNPSSKLAEIVHDDTHGPRSTVEKRFILRKVNAHPHRSSPVARDIPRISKVAPGKHRTKHAKMLDAFGYRSPTPVTNLDAGTEGVLRRLDAALVAFESERRGGTPRRVDPGKPVSLTMAVSRNADNGVDIIMPHGILRSKTLPDQRIHCSLVAPVQSTDKTKRQQLEVVVQKVLQPSASPIVSPDNGFSDRDIATLVKYGMSFLENKEKQSRPANDRSVTTDSNGAPSLLLTNDILGASSGQISSMDDLETEFQRIIAAHAV